MKRPIITFVAALLLTTTPHLTEPLAAEENPAALGGKQLEQEIESMKEAILKEKTKVRQLEEAVLFGKMTSTYLYVTLRTEATEFFNLLDGEFFLNGKILHKLSPEEIKSLGKAPILLSESEAAPGENTLTFQLRFKGQRKGPFAYVEDYTFSLDSKKVLRLDQGKTRAVEIVITDSGFMKNELKDRLNISYNITTGS